MRFSRRRTWRWPTSSCRTWPPRLRATATAGASRRATAAWVEAMGSGDSRFSGAVLCGGRSRRMGRDKALIPVGGTPMAQRVADALWVAGASDVVGVGREPGALASVGLATVPDDRPDAGPAAGIVTALARAGGDEMVMVVGCDLVAPSPAAMGVTVAALARHPRSEEHTSELQSLRHLVCRLL